MTETLKLFTPVKGTTNPDALRTAGVVEIVEQVDTPDVAYIVRNAFYGTTCLAFDEELSDL